ncbi:MAG TPA: GTP 3',8-cyclase MoaA [Desulfomicrobiaceae bacterium]|nr:GTP 3',8-cyclase MoaA [Desulfomicrobiaceae bacterium]
MLVDRHGRKISYLRLSVTDRCNLRCFYCRSQKCWKFIPHPDILSYEEMFELIGLSESLNVEKVRLTGGEPFVRRGFLSFLEKVVKAYPDLDLRITTNGTLLKDKIDALVDMGVTCLNISLDTMDRARFKEITGRDFFPQVRQAIDTCLEKGLRVKVNSVALKNVNHDELPAFVRFARDYPVDVRFIEFMPIGDKTRWSRENYWSADEVMEAAMAVEDMDPVPGTERNGGPARIHTIRGGLGRFGVISAISDHFCASCNRLRITSDGRLRTCLFSDREYKLRGILRSPRLGTDHLRRVISRANEEKPLGADLLEAKKQAGVCNRIMSSIGG